jgi:hypothetical protein
MIDHPCASLERLILCYRVLASDSAAEIRLGLVKLPASGDVQITVSRLYAH